MPIAGMCSPLEGIGLVISGSEAPAAVAGTPVPSAAPAWWRSSPPIPRAALASRKPRRESVVVGCLLISVLRGECGRAYRPAAARGLRPDRGEVKLFG